MNRCATLVVSSLAFIAGAADAQIQRPYTAATLRGEMVVAQAPDITLNGRPARLAPGARIRGENNLLLLSGSLAGQRLVVHYTLDPVGLLLDVWILTPEERARQPWPRTPEQAAAWTFDPATQTWRR
jgi:hypothetical protein